MFDSVDVRPPPGYGDDVPDDGPDAVLARLLADPAASADWPPVWGDETPPAPAPDEWADMWPGEWAGDEPAEFGSCAPSGWLALDLDVVTADAAALSDHTLVEAIVGFDRLASWAAARQARLLDELARRRPADTAPSSARWACVGSEYAPDEVGVALHLARGTACARIGLARRLLATLPDTHALWEAGRIDTPKARAIDDATAVLSDEHARAVQARVLPRAPEQTLAQLKAALARAVLAADPDGAEQRHRQARRDRRVVVTAEADGMGTLWAILTATDAVGAFTWLTRLARGLGGDDPRSMDARRADILAALLNGRLVVDPDTTDTAAGTDTAKTDTATGSRRAATGDGATYDRVTGRRLTGRRSTSSDPATGTVTDPAGLDTGPIGDAGPTGGDTRGGTRGDTRERTRGGPAAPTVGRPIQPVTPGKPLVQIVLAHSTLTGADDHPAELAGHGPIPASLARETAADGLWRRLVTDPLSGTLLDHGRTTYHPPTGLADHVRARDLHCRFPGCRRRAADAELDHIVAWSAGGTTSEPNLAATCTAHHRLKTHAPGWQVTANPDHSLTWTTPTGHRHTTRPHDYRNDAPPTPEPAPSPPPGPPPTPGDPDPDPPPF